MTEEKLTQEQTDEKMIDEAFQELLDQYLKSKHRKKVEIITKAFNFARQAHKGVRRRSGEPYILHPIAVARIACVEIGLGSTSICSALLHDVVEDTDYTVEDIENLFGPKIAQIVDGLTKISGGIFGDRASAQAENFKKLLLTMNDDIRVILIKIADRLHNMRTLGSMLPSKQYKIAGETLYIYAPLANRLGLNRIKTELEDLSFKYEHPEEYAEIEEKLNATAAERDKVFNDFTAPIRTQLDKMGLKYRILARVKSIYSIWNKMQTKHVPFEEIYDLLAVRIIFEPRNIEEELNDCFDIYVSISKIYKPHPDRLRDWVSHPKANGYQALHVTLMGNNGQWIEVQIRSERMNDVAEQGFAAHWKYKEGVRGSSKDDQRLAWIRQIIESQQESNDVEEIVRAIKNDLAPEDVFAFTPKGDMITLPVGSTVIDFAYAIHTQVGHKMCGAKVDKKMVSYDYQIKTGEIIEILTTNVEGHGPSRSWLNICKTNEAKSKIRSWFKKERREENIFEGRNALEREFRRNNIRVPEEELEDFLKMDMHRHSCETLDDFFAAIGYGGVQLSKVMQRLKSEYNKKYGEKAQPDTSDLENKIKTSKNSTGVIVDGIDNCAIKFAQCCNPLPGDEIVGFITRGHGISVHKKDCVNYLSQKDDPENAARWINVKWESSEKHTGYFKCTLDIVAVDRIGLLADVSSALAMINIFIYESTSRELKNGNAMLSVTVSIAGMEQLNNVINKLQKIKNVISVERSGK